MEKTASDFISAVSDAEDRDLLVMAHGFLTELVMRKKSKKPNIKEENLNSQQQINTAISHKYNELLMAVEQKVPSQSRHETALQLIISSQNNNSAGQAEKQQ